RTAPRRSSRGGRRTPGAPRAPAAGPPSRTAGRSGRRRRGRPGRTGRSAGTWPRWWSWNCVSLAGHRRHGADHLVERHHPLVATAAEGSDGHRTVYLLLGAVERPLGGEAGPAEGGGEVPGGVAAGGVHHEGGRRWRGGRQGTLGVAGDEDPLDADAEADASDRRAAE